MMADKRFNIRVYGIYVESGRVLVTDEYRMGIKMTKFPGGGLEFGEGPADCIRRECVEEFDQEFEVVRHFYTTDFFQESAFNKNHQLISIYYLVKPKGPLKCSVTLKPFEFKEEVDGAQCFRWIDLTDLSQDDLTFPIDKLVSGLLKNEFRRD